MLRSIPRSSCFLGTLKWPVTDAEMGKSFASQSWHTTLPSNLPLPLGQKTLQEEEALQDKDLRPPSLAS